MQVSGLAFATSARSGSKLWLRLSARQSLRTGGIHMALDPHMECLSETTIIVPIEGAGEQSEGIVCVSGF